MLRRVKRTWKEGVVISTTSAITHSISVFIIAFISHAAHHAGVEGHVSKVGGVLGHVSGGLICSLGFYLIYRHIKGAPKKFAHTCGSSHHEQDHSHTHHSSKGKFLTSRALRCCHRAYSLSDDCRRIPKWGFCRRLYTRCSKRDAFWFGDVLVLACSCYILQSKW